MANYLLHGTLHVSIYKAEGLINEDRLTGGAPKLFRQVSPCNALLVLIDQSWQAYIGSSAFKICHDNPCVVRWKWEVFLQLLCAFNTGTKFSLCVAVHRGQ